MTVTGKTMIFRNEYGDKCFYKRGVSWKKFKNGQQTNEWQGVYEAVKMPKGTDIPNRTMIEVLDGFESGYENKNGELIRQLIVKDFRIVDQSGDDFQAVDEEIPF